ncbi:MAG: MobF family relaxase, partial [Bacteroidota bacterium]
MRSSTGTIKYFDDHLVSSDYYTQKGQLAGRWGGKAASLLGLHDSVQRVDFVNLCKNINPKSNQQLTQRNVSNRTVCYDFTFSVPKSVSILYSQTKDSEILEAMNNAIEETMKEIEEDAETRVRVDGKYENRKTGNLVWAGFTHEEARPIDGIPDPHLHRHVLVFNATYDEEEEKWKAGQFR